MKKFRQVVLAAAAALVLAGLAPAPAAAQSYCDTLTTGLRLPKPNFNTPSWQFGGCIRNSFDILNSSVPLIGSTATFSQIWTSTISGLNASGLYISSYAVVGSSVYIMGHAQFGSTTTHVGVATFAASGAAVFSLGTSSGISLGGGGLRFADGTYQYTQVTAATLAGSTVVWTGANEWRGLVTFKSTVTTASHLGVLGNIALGASGGSPDFAIDMGPDATTGKRWALYSNGSGGAFYGLGLHGSGFVETWGNDNLITSAYGAGGTFGVGTAAGVAPTAMLQVNRTGGNIIEATNGATSVMAVAAAGNVGIGTASPAYKLHASTGGAMFDGTNNRVGVGSLQSTPYYAVAGSQDDTLSVLGSIVARSTSTTGDPFTISANTGGTIRWGITASGVDYGVSSGEVTFRRYGTSGTVSIYTGGGGNVVIANAANTGLTLETAGNVGVHDLTADAALEVKARAADEIIVLVSSTNDTTALLWVDKYGTVGSTTQPAARWTRTTTLSIANDTNTVLKFLNKEYDTRSMFAVTHATVPTGGDGLYSIRAFASFATGSSAQDSVTSQLRRNLSVLKNGSVVTGCSDVKLSVGNSDETRINVGCTLHLVATDAISVQVYQNQGSAQDVNSAAFEIVKLW